MNYIATPDGKDRPFKFAWKNLKRLAAKMGLKKLSELDQIGPDLEFDHVNFFLFLGFEAGANAEKLEIDFGKEKIEDWLDEDFGLFDKGMTIFGETFGSEEQAGNVKQAKGKK